MGVQRLKTYRLTCDGEIMWKEFREQCDTTTTIQYPSRHELMTDLGRNMVSDEGQGLPFRNWRTNALGQVRCPRKDHVE